GEILTGYDIAARRQRGGPGSLGHHRRVEWNCGDRSNQVARQGRLANSNPHRAQALSESVGTRLGGSLRFPGAGFAESFLNFPLQLAGHPIGAGGVCSRRWNSAGHDIERETLRVAVARIEMAQHPPPLWVLALSGLSEFFG